MKTKTLASNNFAKFGKFKLENSKVIFGGGDDDGGGRKGIKRPGSEGSGGSGN